MKGTLSALQFASAMARAIRRCAPQWEVEEIPVADGGDSTSEVLSKALHAQPVMVKVHDALGRPIEAHYSRCAETAIIEMASASGWKQLAESERNPLNASTYGTGEMILHAVKNGVRRILLGVGGSATVDGGAGMLQALGARLLSSQGEELLGTGANLQHIEKIDLSTLSKEATSTHYTIVCDVNNLLLDAAYVFAPQKGASPTEVKQLANNLKRWASLLEKQCGKAYENCTGTGAAGGITMSLLSFFQAEIVPGAAFILKQVGFTQSLKEADVVITGEGKLDSQSLAEKAPFVVAQQAKEAGKEVWAICGTMESGFSIPEIDRVIALTDIASSPQECLEQPAHWVEKAIERLISEV